MADSINGMTGTELVQLILDFIGDCSDETQSYVERMLPLAEFRFLKAHKWSFLQFSDYSLAVTAANDKYELISANVSDLSGNEFIQPDDIESVFDKTNNRDLRKIDLQDMVKQDPDCSRTGNPKFWAVIDDKTIRLWPTPDAALTLSMNGQKRFASTTTLGDTIAIPYRYQDTFYRYALGMALERENDDRAQSIKREAFEYMKNDIQEDSERCGDTTNPRVKDLRESRQWCDDKYYFLYR